VESIRYVESRISSLVDSKREMSLRRATATTENLIASFDAIIKDMEEEIARCHIKRRALERATVTDANNKDATESDSE
jgi:ribosome-associated translation inhibitor RaiA